MFLIIQIVGFCLFFYTYSTWEGKVVHMEVIYLVHISLIFLFLNDKTNFSKIFQKIYQRCTNVKYFIFSHEDFISEVLQEFYLKMQI